jgi:hypothetical protein
MTNKSETSDFTGGLKQESLKGEFFNSQTSSFAQAFGLPLPDVGYISESLAHLNRLLPQNIL